MPMHDLTGLQISEPDFCHLSQLCRLDLKFPSTWEGWQDLMNSSMEEATARDAPRAPVRISLNDFERWCQRVEIVPSLDGLRA